MIYNYSLTKIMGTGMGYDDTELRREISDIKSTLDVKANVEQVPTKISELSNDSGYITSIPSEYITETELDSKGYINSIPSEYITETELNAKDYVTTSSLDSKGYLTSIPETYVTDTELEAKGYLTEHQDISNLATKDELPSVYISGCSRYQTGGYYRGFTLYTNVGNTIITDWCSKTSQLENDANFVTQDTVNAIDARVTALENDVTASNQTIDEINSMI